VDVFVKRGPEAPPGFVACEVAGLSWLAAAEGGAACARVVGHDATSLTLERLRPVAPDRAAAYGFGCRLARTHDAGAEAFGAPPDGWTGPGFFGPLHSPLPMSLAGHPTWGRFYAAERLSPMAELAGPRLGAVSGDVRKVISRCRRGDFDDDDQPARLHGDLWSGNVMWTSDGVVLIDPAAHGGHRETDLAMLALFGCPFLDVVIDGYQHERPLRTGWRQRVGLHQLYPLLAHVVLFGGGYVAQTRAAARSALAAG
jgi:fructosamine-3-kinase